MQAITLFGFNSESTLNGWRTVNDGVMGGISTSTINISREGFGLFRGHVSLDNNGGFCSVKYVFDTIALATATQFTIRLKGDGKNYQFRVKTNKTDSHSYMFSFSTTADWQTITIPIRDLYPVFRGKSLNIPNFNGSSLEEISFFIANKKQEDFSLLIDKIEIQ